MRSSRSGATSAAAAGARACGSRGLQIRSSRRAPSARSAAGTAIIDEALSLAERLADAAEKGRVDLPDLGRRARRLLESTSRPSGEGEKLF
jgi:hypothetical protein